MAAAALPSHLPGATASSLPAHPDGSSGKFPVVENQNCKACQLRRAWCKESVKNRLEPVRPLSGCSVIKDSFIHLRQRARSWTGGNQAKEHGRGCG
eukprot:6209733-Pleurochrysis_carterae.AAC.1